MTNLEPPPLRNQRARHRARRTFTTRPGARHRRAGGFLTLLTALAAMAAACDGSSGLNSAGPPPVPEPEVFRIDRIDVPASFQEVDQASLDLDGDGAADDAAGAILVALMQWFDSARAELPDAIARRLSASAPEVDWLLELDRDPDTGEVIAVALRRGSDPDGDGRYQVDDLLSPQPSTVPVSLFGDVLGTSAITWIDATAVTARLEDDPGGEGGIHGRVGFALSPERAAQGVAAPMARFLTERLQAGTLVYSADMDADGDGTITPDEFLDFRVIGSLFAPDLDLDPDQPGNDALSAGFRIHATPIEIARR